METILSERVKRIRPSATLAISSKANELKASGKNIINLGVGEPDFHTPEHIKHAAIQAIEENFTRYTAVDGIAELKQAIINKFKKDNQLDYHANQILVSCGGKQSFFNLAQAILNPGDEVIIPAPYWVSYPDMVLIADGKPKIIATSFAQHYKINPEQLEQAITKNTKLFVINSPSNPSGIAYSKAELEALGEVLRRHPHVLIATDDMYEHILWAKEPFCNILMACPDLYDRTFVLNGVSKAYAMTGWRIGYAAGPASVIAAMKKVQSQSTSNPSSISQKAAVAALSGDQQCVTKMVAAFHQRHEKVFRALNKISGVQCHPSDGTFYSFPNIEAAIASLTNCDTDIDFASQLLEQTGVALVPGSAFGSPGSIRLSFAVSEEQMDDALQRLAQFIQSAKE